MAGIRTGAELANFLRKALEIEMGFESVSQWEGYINVKKDDFRDIIFTLISESEKHRGLVEAMISKVKGPFGSKALPLQPHSFNFKNKVESEIMMDLSRYEKLAYDTYLNIREALQNSNIGSLVDEKDTPFFLSTLDVLIKEEANHTDLLTRYLGHVERIR